MKKICESCNTKLATHMEQCEFCYRDEKIKDIVEFSEKFSYVLNEGWTIDDTKEWLEESVPTPMLENFLTSLKSRINIKDV